MRQNDRDVTIMLKTTVNSGMKIECEDIFKSSIQPNEFSAMKKGIHTRMYKESDDISKYSLVSDELNTLRSDLKNATESLEKSLSMAESLKVSRKFTTTSRKIRLNLIKESLRNVAIDKQLLQMRLHESVQCNGRLRRKVIEQQKNFQKKTNRMQYEIDDIKNSLAATKVYVGQGSLFKFNNVIFSNLDRILQYEC